MSALLKLLSRQIGSQQETTRSDADLVHAYAEQRCEAAFRVLVARHGPLVWGVCRRWLGHLPDAEDAFQATFLVLARNAGSLRRPEVLAAWLHGVARRIASRARAARAQRQRVEGNREPLAAPSPSVASDIVVALDQEIGHLPERYRAALLLCYWEGLSHAEASRRLGCTEGALRGRLERGRRWLEQRLRRRGFGLQTLLVASLGSCIVPGELLARTVRLGDLTETVPSAIALLAAGPATLRWTLGAMGTGLLVLMALMLGSGSLERTPAAPPQVFSEDRAKPSKPVDTLGDPLPEGALARIGTTRLRAQGYITAATFSPDDRLIAWGTEHDGLFVADSRDGRTVLHFREDEIKTRPVSELSFSPDSQLLAAGGYWAESLRIIHVATGRILHTLPNTTAGHDRWSREWQGPGFAFTPDGRTLVVGGKDGALHLWDVKSGTRQASLDGATGFVASLTLSADGRTALTAHAGGEMHLWDLVQRKHERKCAGALKIPHLALLSPNGQHVALASNPKEILLQGRDGEERYRLQPGGVIHGLGWSRISEILNIADSEGRVTTWDATTGKVRNTVMCAGISFASRAEDRMGPGPRAWFHPNGTRMAWADGSNLRLWNLTTQREEPIPPNALMGVNKAAFSPDGRSLLVGGGRGEMGVWDAATGRLLQKSGWSLRPSDVRYTIAPDRRSLVVVTGGDYLEKTLGPHEGRIFPWDSTAKIAPRPVVGQLGPAYYACLSPDNRYVVATGMAPEVRVFDTATGHLLRVFPGSSLEYQPTFTADGRLLATLVADKYPSRVRLYEFSSGRIVREFSEASNIGGFAISPDGALLATGHMASPFPRPGQPAEGDALILWDLATGKKLRRMSSGHHHVEGVAFTPDGRLLASCGFNNPARLWEVSTGQERRRFEGHRGWVRSVDFSPDGSRLVTASLDGTALVWHVYGPTDVQGSTLEAAWSQLREAGIVAHRAMSTLISDPKTPDFLGARLTPIILPNEAQIQRWLDELGSADFTTRETAQQRLGNIADMIESSLRRAQENTTDADLKRRLATLLDGIPHPERRPENLRELRAVEVLERIGTPAARQVLTKLAKGSPTARLTREATASLSRLR